MSVLPYETPPAAVPAKGARSALLLLLTINLFNYIDRYVLAAVEPEIRKHFFAEAADPSRSAKEQMMAAMAKTGSLATAFLVSYMIAAPVFGWLATRMSRWVLVGLSVAIWSLASGASGLAMTFGILVLTRCFVGIGEAGYGPSAPTIIADLFPVEKRGAKLAWFYMAIPVGSALGYVLGGAVSTHWGWRWPFYLVVPPGIALAVWAFMMRKKLPSTPGQSAAPDSSAPDKPKAGIKDYLGILKIRSYLFATAGMAAMTFAIGGFSFWMPAYLVDSAHAGDLQKVNLYFGAITVVAGITATLAGGWLGDYLRRYTGGSYFIVSAAGMLLGTLFIVLMMHTPFPMAWVWLFLAVFFLFLNTGPSNTILANVTSPAVRASAFALNILIIHALGDAISPPILGAIIGGVSWNAALYVVCGTMVLAAVLWLAGTPHLARDTAKVEGTPQV
jgi:MFS transporter, Spinster family, sphingosine-1-phosphate transporter